MKGVLNLSKEEYGPYIKPNDVPVYVHSQSNHPPKILENIPKGINKRLSLISATEEIFEKAKPIYQEALKKSGYDYNLKFENLNIQDEQARAELNKNKRNRKRKIIWFNPPFSKEVKTNVGAKFLRLIDKHFPKSSPLHKIFNRNSVKTSYRCTQNLNRKISAHNRKILYGISNSQDEDCNCTKEECPVGGLCRKSGVIYNATVKRDDGVIDTYIGLTENQFKTRYAVHNSTNRTRNPRSACNLNKYIWDLQDRKIGYTIDWRIVSRANSFDPTSGICNLCNKEKYFILFKPEMSTINERDEVAGPCLHKHNKLLKKS